MMLISDPDRWSRLDAGFHQARSLPPAERDARLAELCEDDVDLRAEIEAMLAADDPGRALRLERLVPADDGPGAGTLVGMRLGAWKVGELIGHGGMGTVYLAERADGQYEQRVALKVVQGAAHHPGATARFTAETHILARLSHPNIARLLDAGVTPEGSAFLVMEHVDGQPVTGYCDERRLTIDERLRLFSVVCTATQRAHESLIVHRDLKPSNIFVSRAGDVKLLDFGIAKLLEPDDPFATDTTGLRASDAGLRRAGAARRCPADDRGGRVRARRRALRTAHRSPPLDGRRRH